MVTPAPKYCISVCAFYPQSGIQLFAISDVEIAESEDTTAGRLENRRRLQAAAEDRRRDHKRPQEV